MSCVECSVDASKTEYKSVPPVHPNCRCNVDEEGWELQPDACEHCQKAANAWQRRRKSIAKIDDEKRQVFGFASSPTVDAHNEMIDAETLEKAVYRFVREYRVGKEMHQGEPVATLIESIFITKDKAEILGIDPEHTNKWFLGFQVEDESLWQKVKSGDFRMFSIGGKARKI